MSTITAIGVSSRDMQRLAPRRFVPNDFYKQSPEDLFDLLLRLVQIGHRDTVMGCHQAAIRAGRPEPNPAGPFLQYVSPDTPKGIWRFDTELPDSSDHLIVFDLVNHRAVVGLDRSLVDRFVTDAENEHPMCFDHYFTLD